MIFDHIGVVVSELHVGRSHLSELFSVDRWTKEFDDPVNLVHVQFGFDHSDCCYEVISPSGPASPVSVDRTEDSLMILT
jgi:hypothetical protein